MSARTNSVNLLPPSDFELSFWGRFLKWAVTTGRYIIILTELVVILAFLSRFKLDEDLRNLNEQIQTQVSFLETEEEQLQEFLQVQRKLGLVSRELESTVNVHEMMDYITQRTPPEVKIYQYAFVRDELTISATTLSENSMGAMLTEMNRDGTWKTLDLTQITSDPVSGIKFTLTAKK